MIALAVGHCTLDVYPDGLKVGGSVAYAARTWRALGATPQVITAAGPDFPPMPEGWDVRPSAETTRFSNTYDAVGNRRQVLVSQADRLSVGVVSQANGLGVGASGPPGTAAILAALSGHQGGQDRRGPGGRPTLAFLCPVLQDFAPEPWIDALRGTPLLGAGLQGWLKHAVPGGEVEYGPRTDPTAFRGLHVAFLSEEDLAGRLDWLDQLCSMVPLVYLTRGRQGALLFRRGSITRIGVCPAREVDPTGAGDTFAAATLLALARGASPVEAGRLGAAAASITVEHRAAAPLRALRGAPERLSRMVSGS